MKRYYLSLVVVVVMIMVGCDTIDTTDPVISDVQVNGTSSLEYIVEASATMVINFKVSDNEELNQCKLEIHAADDGHTHEGIDTQDYAPNVGSWSESAVMNLDGNSSSHELEFVVPDSIAGHWHLVIQLIDITGNQAEQSVSTLQVENDKLPVISITSTTPALNDDDIMILPINNIPALTGEVTDPDGLDSVRVAIELQSNSNVYWSQDFDLSGETSFDLSTVDFEPVSITGSYYIHIHAKDVLGYRNISEIRMKVE